MEMLKLKALKLAECNGRFTEDLMDPGGPDGNWYAEESVAGERVLVDFSNCGAYDRSLQLIKHLTLTDDQVRWVRSALGGVVVDGKIRNDEKATLVLFDCILYRGQDVRAEPLVRRRRHAGASAPALAPDRRHAGFGLAHRRDRPQRDSARAFSEAAAGEVPEGRQARHHPQGPVPRLRRGRLVGGC